MACEDFPCCGHEWNDCPDVIVAASPASADSIEFYPDAPAGRECDGNCGNLAEFVYGRSTLCVECVYDAAENDWEDIAL